MTTINPITLDSLEVATPETAADMGTALKSLKGIADNARQMQIELAGRVSSQQKWTESQLTGDGIGNVFIKAALEKYHGKPASVGELSKFRTYSHPKVREKIPTCFKHAETVADAIKTAHPQHERPKPENVALKLMKHYKEGAANIESASEKAIEELTNALNEKSSAKKFDRDTAQGTKDWIEDQVGKPGFTKHFTAETLGELRRAIANLQPSTVETPAEVPSPEPAPEPAPENDVADVHAALNGDLVAQVTAGVLAALQERAK